MKIVIADDHCMTRDLLRIVSTRDLGHEVVAEAADGPRAIQAVLGAKPDLVLLDLQLPRLDGFGVIEAIRRETHRPRVLVLSTHCDEYTVYCVERARVHGFLDKREATVATLRIALAAVAEGRCHFSAAFQRVKAARHANPWAFDKLLTDREQTVLAMIGELLTDDQIAQRLHLSAHTAEKHRFNILRKLGLRTKTTLARYAFEHGFRGYQIGQPEPAHSNPGLASPR